jgi:hypothetical protein
MVFDRRRRRAHRASRDARLSTGYERAIDNRKTSEVHASMRSTAWCVAARGAGWAGRESLGPSAGREIVQCVCPRNPLSHNPLSYDFADTLLEAESPREGGL